MLRGANWPCPSSKDDLISLPLPDTHLSDFNTVPQYQSVPELAEAHIEEAPEEDLKVKPPHPANGNGKDNNSSDYNPDPENNPGGKAKDGSEVGQANPTVALI